MADTIIECADIKYQNAELNNSGYECQQERHVRGRSDKFCLHLNGK
jgi:hypothetical protein